jgi:hypothetical protein
MDATQNNSEVARLMAEIEAEYTAAMRGLNGYAMTSEHELITRRVENMGEIHKKLQALVGDKAIAYVAQAIEAADSPDC